MTDHIWIVPIGVEGGGIVYTRPMKLCAETLSCVGGSRDALELHLPGTKDKYILSVRESNTKLGKECRVNIQQKEEAEAFYSFAVNFQERVNAAFTPEEIESIGEPLVIEYTGFPAVRVMFAVGILLTLPDIVSIKRGLQMDFYKKMSIVCGFIPYGRVATYGQIALLCGMPKNARQVGYGLRRGLAGDRIPAHRIVNGKGFLSGAGSFETWDMQKLLLEKEGVEVAWTEEGWRVDLKRYGWKNTMEEALRIRELGSREQGG